MTELSASWRDTPTRAAIVDFVERVTTEGGPEQRRHPPCEKPMPIELGFILGRLAEMAEADDSLRAKQPWKAARTSLETAAARGWTVVSIKNDWDTVFADAPAA